MTRDLSEFSPAEQKRQNRTRTFLGFDYGIHKIGLAIGQDLTRTARGLETVRANKSTPNWARITHHIDTWQPSALVVGLALDSAGGETEMSGHARKFGQALSARYHLPVYWANEYLSSDAARHVQNRQAKLSKIRDQVAACLILETFLNQSKS